MCPCHAPMIYIMIFMQCDIDIYLDIDFIYIISLNFVNQKMINDLIRISSQISAAGTTFDFDLILCGGAPRLQDEREEDPKVATAAGFLGLYC